MRRSLHYLLPSAITSLTRGGGVATLSSRDRRLSTSASAAAAGGEFSEGKSAYEVLGISENSSSAEIKASFRRLAKETHPDVLAASQEDASNSQRFLQILAAYEILSDFTKRAHYDSYLLSQRATIKRHHGLGSAMTNCQSSVIIDKQSNVVEWLKWYKLTIDDILMEKRVSTGSGYFAEMENELYSAIRAAYYGPLIASMDLLPECFEAEERSACDTPEVLHIVSGRDLFGIVKLVDKVPEISDIFNKKLTLPDSSSEAHEVLVQHLVENRRSCSRCLYENKINQEDNVLDANKDLELHLFGRMIAMASRIPNCNCLSLPETDSDDHIHVFLMNDDTSDSRTLLGRISGLGTSAEEGHCSVFDGRGTKTHLIMKHRTLMVKHMHWYRIQDQVSVCECRCSRARLPSSKFWLFHPRSPLHDVGGWYIETFGRDKKGKSIPSQRQWDGVTGYAEKRLHPAIYLLALAYRTLDLEHAKRKRWSMKDFFQPKFYRNLRRAVRQKRRFLADTAELEMHLRTELGNALDLCLMNVYSHLCSQDSGMS